MNILDLTKEYDWLLFDFDGTLVDTGEGIINATRHALKLHGIIEDNLDNLRRFIGPPLTEAFSEYYGFSREESVEVVTNFRQYYVVQGWKESSIYPGIVEMLDILKKEGKHLCIATSKPEELAITISKRDGIMDYFEFLGGSIITKETEYRTHKPDVIEYVLDSVGVADRSRVVMIGDRFTDITGAKACSLKSIGVLWGYGSCEELTSAGSDYLADTPV